jgi:hypothetical protein
MAFSGRPPLMDVMVDVTITSAESPTTDPGPTRAGCPPLPLSPLTS